MGVLNCTTGRALPPGPVPSPNAGVEKTPAKGAEKQDPGGGVGEGRRDALEDAGRPSVPEGEGVEVGEGPGKLGQEITRTIHHDAPVLEPTRRAPLLLFSASPEGTAS